MKDPLARKEDPQRRLVKRRCLRFASAAGIGIASVAGASRSGHAQQPRSGCEVHVIPSAPPEAWRASVRQVESRVRGTPECRELTIAIGEGHATLVFVTTDDRRAVRDVDTPSALGAVADALLVTVPLTTDAPPDEASPTPVAPTLTAAPMTAETALEEKSAPAPADLPSPVPSPERRSLLIHGAVGGRLGFPASYASPTLGLAVGLSTRWDLCLLGQWDVVSTRASLPSDFRRTSLFAGAGAGRRLPMGDVALLGGILAGASFDSESFSTTTASPGSGPGDQQSTSGDGQQSQVGEASSTATVATRHTSSRVEPRAGLYFGVAFPRRSRVRFRSTLTADVVPTRLGRELSLDPAVPSLPWWSLGLSIGVEGAIP
jgi:hypothetical protein